MHYSKPGSHSGVQRTCNGYYVGSDGTVHDPHGCGGIHTIIPDGGSLALPYDIVSIKISIPETLPCYNETELKMYCTEIYPGENEGEVTWSTPFGNFTGPVAVANYQPGHEGEKIIATYTVNGVSYSDTATIQNVKPTISFPYEIACVDGKAKITVLCDPPFDSSSGDEIIWTIPAATSCSGKDCEFDVNPNLPEDQQKITAVYKHKCEVSAPAQATVKLNKFTGFSLPGCVDTIVEVKNIASTFFDGPCHPEVIFTPSVIGIERGAGPMQQTQTVTATAGGISFTKEIILVDPDTKITPEDFDIASKINEALETIEEVAEQINDLLNAFDTGNLPLAPSKEFEVNFPSAGSPAVTVEFSQNCCPTELGSEVKTGVEVEVGYEMSVKLGITVPVVIPPIPPLLAYISLGASMEAGAKIAGTLEAKCPPLPRDVLCYPFHSSGTLTGSVVALGGLASGTLSANLNVLSGSGQLCMTYPPLGATLSGNLTLGGLSANAQFCWGLSVFESCYTSPNLQIWAGYPINFPTITLYP